jgi:hypothetical protein
MSAAAALVGGHGRSAAAKELEIEACGPLMEIAVNPPISNRNAITDTLSLADLKGWL